LWYNLAQELKSHSDPYGYLYGTNYGYGCKPLCLTAYPTDNKLKAQDCLKKFKTFVEKFKQFGIVVDAIASDGDCKYISAQKKLFKYGVRPLPVFHGSIYLEIFKETLESLKTLHTFSIN
jgi:hypothetical protein